MSFPSILEDRKLGGFTLLLGDVRRLRRTGWTGFTLLLRGPGGRESGFPVIEGIRSAGGKDGVKPWMDLIYRSDAFAAASGAAAPRYPSGPRRPDRMLFACLGETIPPGGHLMLSYEEELPPHLATLHSLAIGIPPVLTPLGLLLIAAGFHFIKDWYLSEGGFEGPRKLWAEKAPDARWSLALLDRTAAQVTTYLARAPDPARRALEEPARKRAPQVLRATGKRPGTQWPVP
jgi:hypothetical protein